MNQSYDLPLEQKFLLERLDKIQEEIHTVLISCVEELFLEETTNTVELKELILLHPQQLKEIQKHSIKSLLSKLDSLKWHQQDLIAKIDEYTPRSGLPGKPQAQALPKYGCPRCPHTKYLVSPQQGVGRCPVHNIQLVRK